MRKELANLRWHPLWVSHIGCIKGCLDYLGLDVSTAWLFGATGHAFLLNICEGVDLSGPTALNLERLLALGKNIGYATGQVSGARSDADYREVQQRAWERTRWAIDRGLPCYAWNLDPRFPEFYVIYGYDTGDEGEIAGYCFSGPGSDAGAGPVPWQGLGDDPIGWLAVQWLEPGQPADDVKTVKDAFAFALAHAEGAERWVYPGFRSGLAGYDLWIQELEAGRASGAGVGLNAGNWSECRNYAVEFLVEAKERLGPAFAGLLEEAIEHYRRVAAHLSALVGIFPFDERRPWQITDRARVELAVECLGAARDAEASGLAALRRIVRLCARADSGQASVGGVGVLVDG